MLLQLIVRNYRSIKDEVSLSLLASKDKSHYEQLIDFDNQKVLRSALIFGENGSGKTAFIEALKVVSTIISTGASMENGDSIKAFPNIDLCDKPTYTACYFTQDNIMYFYSIEYSTGKINTERLYYWPNGKKVMVFERDGNKYEFNKAIKSDMKKVVGFTKSYQSIVSIASFMNIKSIAAFSQTFTFFRYKLILGPVSLNRCVEFLNKFKFAQVPLNRFMKSLNIGFVKMILGETAEDTYITFENFTLQIFEVSSGINHILQLFCACMQAVISDGIVVLDCIDDKISTSFITNFMKRFLNNGRNCGQILATCYTTELLNVSILRRDQVWFTARDTETFTTDLYSLGDITNVRKEENIRLGFLSGKYGALHSFNEDPMKIFNS